MIHRIVGITLLLSVFALAPRVAAQPQLAGPKVHTTIVLDHAAATPGQVVWALVEYEIAPEWHIYWPGQNDTGMAPLYDWVLPDGWLAGQPRYAAPQRYEHSGGMVDYILEGKTGVLVPIKVPEKAEVGSTHLITLNVEWLVCKEACIAERASLRASLTVGSDNKPSPNAPRVQAAAAQLPRDISKAEKKIDVAISEEGQLTIRSTVPSRIRFFPAADARPVHETIAGASAYDGFWSAQVGGEPDEQIAGLIEMVLLRGQREYYWYRNPSTPQREADGFEIVEAPKPDANAHE